MSEETYVIRPNAKTVSSSKAGIEFSGSCMHRLSGLYHEIFLFALVSCTDTSDLGFRVIILSRYDAQDGPSRHVIAIRLSFLLEYRFDCRTLKKVLDFGAFRFCHCKKIASRVLRMRDLNKRHFF